MLTRLLLLILLVVPHFESLAQSDSSLYWKNRPPYSGYWQQDVAYTINAKLDETTHRIIGKQSLIYTNNSPDTLNEVFFHLYQNAFVQNSYTRKLENANKVKAYLGKYEKEDKGIEIQNILVNKHVVKGEIDNTILKIALPKPLMPNQHIEIEMEFITYYDRGSTRRRMQMYREWGHVHYNGCQWFPKISVYDSKFGWDTHQHLGKEFYGNFGTYDVTLDFADNYIVEATGMLMNREEALPSDLREKVDLKHFIDKPWNEAPSEIIPYQQGKRKKWHFKASLVHDFAFTASPTYRLDTRYFNGVECVAIVQESHASGWKNAADYVAKTIEVLSSKFGTYHYPKMVAADARDGMEYPMITLDGGKDPGYRGLLVHEIAHNWYYGMVGSNETYRAGLDEGFTQFLTSEGLRMIDGDTLIEEKQNKYKAKFEDVKLTRDVRVYNAYIYDGAHQQDHSLNTHSDEFNGALHHGGGYRSVYYKTAVMLYNLEYVLGDSLFNAAMIHYFDQWKFAHPYMNDFKNSIIHFTKMDLNWFFDQWWETTKVIDYKVGKIKHLKNNTYEIAFKRKGSMQMPLDFTITDVKGKTYDYYIPNTWYEKSTKAQTLQRWIGWGKMNSTYQTTINLEQKLKSIQIDPSQRLADINMLNNSKGRHFIRPAINTKFDFGINQPTQWNKLSLLYRPDIWYSASGKLKIGAHISTNHLNSFHQLEASVWLNTSQFSPKFLQPARWINYNINYSNPLSYRTPFLVAHAQSSFIDGLWKHKIQLDWELSQQSLVTAQIKSLYQDNLPAYDAFYPNYWSSVWQQKNTFIQLDYFRSTKGFRSNNYLNLGLRASLSRYFDYKYFYAENINQIRFHKFVWRNRVYARAGLGEKTPEESVLMVNGANGEEMADSKFYRSKGLFPESWIYGVHNIQLHAGGGLNLKGYSKAFKYLIDDGKRLHWYFGNSGIAYNTELDITDLILWQPKLTKKWLGVNLYLFADAGVIQLNKTEEFSYAEDLTIDPVNKFTPILVDAGIGTTFTIKKWGPFEKAKPLVIRIDYPFLVRNINGNDHFNQKFIVGINRTF